MAADGAAAGLAEDSAVVVLVEDSVAAAAGGVAPAEDFNSSKLDYCLLVIDLFCVLEVI